jgi:hypothetical protein
MALFFARSLIPLEGVVKIKNAPRGEIGLLRWIFLAHGFDEVLG